MAKKISDLSNKSTLAGTEQLEINDGGTSKRATAQAVADLAAAPDAGDVAYDNGASGLSATDVQAALDELASGSGGGDITGPGSSTDNTLPRWDGSGGDVLQGSGVVVSDSDEISGYRGNINLQTGTSYSLQASDSGKIVELTNGASIALTLTNTLPVGWCATIVQGGDGVVTFTPSSSTLHHRQSHTKTAGKYAMCVLYVSANSSGSAAVFNLGGDTAT